MDGMSKGLGAPEQPILDNRIMLAPVVVTIALAQRQDRYQRPCVVCYLLRVRWEDRGEIGGGFRISARFKAVLLPNLCLTVNEVEALCVHKLRAIDPVNQMPTSLIRVDGSGST